MSDQSTNAIRCLAIDTVQKANSGHPGAPMGMAPMADVLFSEFMSFDPKAPKWHNRDRFVFNYTFNAFNDNHTEPSWFPFGTATSPRP